MLIHNVKLYIEFELFLIIFIDRLLLLNNLTKALELIIQLKKVYYYKFGSNVVYYLLNAHINMNNIYFETKHKKRLTYILMTYKS